MSDTPRTDAEWAAWINALPEWQVREFARNVQRELAAAKAERDAAQAKYDELIYQVGTKWPNETRHETALRYIKRYENSLGDLSAKADAAVAAKVK